MLAVVDLPCTPHGKPIAPMSKLKVSSQSPIIPSEMVRPFTAEPGSRRRCALKLNYNCTMTTIDRASSCKMPWRTRLLGDLKLPYATICHRVGISLCELFLQHLFLLCTTSKHVLISTVVSLKSPFSLTTFSLPPLPPLPTPSFTAPASSSSNLA